MPRKKKRCRYSIWVVEVRVLTDDGFTRMFVTNYIATSAEAAEAMGVDNAKSGRTDNAVVMAKAKRRMR